jgi:hypothetical protein
MVAGLEKRWRSVLPWVVSAALLFYVFGYATQWDRLLAALEQADVTRFLIYASADRLAFFVVWTWLSALALRRFVVHVPIASVFAIRGGSELARAVSNPLSDAAYVLGLVQLCGGRLDAVLASMLVPVISHFFVMLVQMTIAMPFQSGGFAAVRSVAIVTAGMWVFVAAGCVSVALVRSGRLQSRRLAPVAAWLVRFPLREIAPFVAGFTALAIFDVHIQWLASRAFGVPIEWAAIATRLPLVYLTFLIPTLGNFGTRELTWAALFDEFGDRDALIAYAFSINAIFLVLNVLLGVIFLSRALQLIGAVRQAQREGGQIPRPLLGDPTDP